MMQAAIYGRLGQDPRSIETKSGTPMCASSVAVDLADKNGETHTEWLSVIAFGRNADVLAKHSKGDLVAISGRCQLNNWTDRDGESRSQLQVVADSVLSARAVRPGGKRKESEASSARAGPSPEFDDDIPF